MIPKLVFIVPYRDRIQHLTHFNNYMKHVLEDMDPNDYKIFIAHQDDKRSFNRGAIKNIGFLAIKKQYPNDYKDITFVFNDVDTIPYDKNILNYETSNGIIKHFYGFTHALGGIFSIKGEDFEKTNGFPNLWSWGYEDNLMQERVLSAGLKIDRSNFFPLGNQNILHFYDGMGKAVSRKEIKASGLNDNNLHSLYNIKCVINGDWINIKHFDAVYDDSKYKLEQVHINNIQQKLRPIDLNMFR